MIYIIHFLSQKAIVIFVFFCIFLPSPHQVDMKNVVKCLEDFFGYFNALESSAMTLIEFVAVCTSKLILRITLHPFLKTSDLCHSKYFILKNSLTFNSKNFHRMVDSPKIIYNFCSSTTHCQTSSYNVCLTTHQI